MPSLVPKRSKLSPVHRRSQCPVSTAPAPQSPVALPCSRSQTGRVLAGQLLLTRVLHRRGCQAGPEDWESQAPGSRTLTLTEVHKSYELWCVESSQVPRCLGQRDSSARGGGPPPLQDHSENRQPESGISTRRTAAPCCTGRALPCPSGLDQRAFPSAPRVTGT